MWDLLPELTDHIFELLDGNDLYNCLFVSHDFNAHASRLLYRDIEFHAGFTALYSNTERKMQCYRKQESLWQNFAGRAALARYIYYLKINPLYVGEEEMFPPFPERVSYIIRNATSLQHIDYIVIDRGDSSDYSVELLRTIITALESLEIKPALFIKSRRPILGKPLLELLVYINDRFTVHTLDVLSEGTQDDKLLLFLARFPQLQKLAVWFFGVNDNNAQDMDSVLGHLSLKELTIHDSGRFLSFPHQTQILEILHDDRILTDSIWTATCNLRHLSNLNIECLDVEEREDEQQLTFSSSDLRSVSLSLGARAEEIVRRQIIQPICSSSQRLTYVELYINTSLSSNLLALILSIETLVNVKIASLASPYTFLDFVSFPKTLPKLETLRLPWPATIGIPTNDDDGVSMDWRYERDRSQDIPDRLSFDLCQLLSTKYPILEDIVFVIDTAGIAGNELFDWIKSASSNSISYFDPLDLNKIRIIRPGNNLSFVDEISRCLCMSSLLHYSGSPTFAPANEGTLEPVTAYIFLDLVRIHASMPYLILS